MASYAYAYGYAYGATFQPYGYAMAMPMAMPMPMAVYGRYDLSHICPRRYAQISEPYDPNLVDVMTQISWTLSPKYRVGYDL